MLPVEILKMSSRLHVRAVLDSIDFISKIFFLSPFKSISKFKPLPSWNVLSFWSIWTLVGFFTHISFHIIYVVQNDNVESRPKLVTVFIDMYNKYCGLLVNGTLVLIGYFQQTNIAKIHLLLGEIEDIFMKQMKIKINNLNTLRWVKKLKELLIATFQVFNFQILLDTNEFDFCRHDLCRTFELPHVHWTNVC